MNIVTLTGRLGADVDLRQTAMAPEYVMRCMGNQRQDLCDRCGKVRPVTMAFKYTMKGKVKERKGLL